MNIHPTTFYLVRHGQTDWNAKGIMQGQLDSSLSEIGREEARKTSESLQSIVFDTIYCSDLLRSRQTAEIFNLTRNLPIEVSPALRERNMGMYQGKELAFYRADVKRQFEGLTDEGKWIWKFGGSVESYEETYGRTTNFLLNISKAHPNKNFMVVSHAGPMRSMLVALGFAKLSELPSGSVTNQAIIKIHIQENKLSLAEAKGIEMGPAEIKSE